MLSAIQGAASGVSQSDNREGRLGHRHDGYGSSREKKRPVEQFDRPKKLMRARGQVGSIRRQLLQSPESRQMPGA
tara:strand:+ start:402666 stop:402890 length:225 start_codon:yes stop_codon:yes gene_type:complete